MRYSLPIALALAAVTVAGASGTASAGSNNSNIWGAPLFANSPTKPPKANQNSSTTQKALKTAPTPVTGEAGAARVWHQTPAGGGPVQQPRGNNTLHQD